MGEGALKNPWREKDRLGKWKWGEKKTKVKSWPSENQKKTYPREKTL